MTPTKLKMMGDVLFEGLVVVGGSPTITDTLGVGVIVAGRMVDSVTGTLSRLMTVVKATVLSPVSVYIYTNNENLPYTFISLY